MSQAFIKWLRLISTLKARGCSKGSRFFAPEGAIAWQVRGVKRDPTETLPQQV